MISGTVMLSFGELVGFDPEAHGVLARAEKPSHWQCPAPW